MPNLFFFPVPAPALVRQVGFVALLLATILVSPSTAQESPQFVAAARIPSDVRCIVVTVVGERKDFRKFDVLPGQDAVVRLKGLPIGVVSVSEEAFGQSCAEVSSDTDANWFSEPVIVTLVQGSAVEAALTLRRNGKLVVTSSFLGLPDEPETNPLLSDCRAQRLVHIVAGRGGLAWFTTLWPPFDAATNLAAANDGPGNFDMSHAEGAARLYVRSTRFMLWEATGTHPEVSVFVAGLAVSHSFDPHMMERPVVGGNDVLADIATIQGLALASPIPVLQFTLDGFRLNSITDGDLIVDDIDGAIAAIRLAVGLTPEQELLLRPSPEKIATLVTSSSADQRDLATKLIFTANAFRLGLVSTVQIPAFQNDPHRAFSRGNAEVKNEADSLAGILQAFYLELAKSTERSCGLDGHPLALSDNVAMIISGDTPKEPFIRDDWPDSFGKANIIYFRSNGFIWPGWFGEFTGPARTYFLPSAGLNWNHLDNPAVSLRAAQIAILYSAARGVLSADPIITFPIDAMTTKNDNESNWAQ